MNLNLPLAKPTTYEDHYNNKLLVGIPRNLARNKIGLPNIIEFSGVDIWNCYEVSWLNNKGKPCVRIIQFLVPVESEYLIESKSLKLYLNSLNGTKFNGDEQVKKIIEKDLTNIAKSNIEATIYSVEEFHSEPLSLFDGINIDDLDVEISDYEVNKHFLRAQNNTNITETLYSNLLKSNCLITNQPDWASVQIKYSGKKIDHKSLLQYIISFRKHNEFHEQCIEHMFKDIMEQCSPTELTIHAKYTRRGGIDINPFRTSLNFNNRDVSKTRDVRQ